MGGQDESNGAFKIFVGRDKESARRLHCFGFSKMLFLILTSILALFFFLIYKKSESAINAVKTTVPGMVKTHMSKGNLPDIAEAGSLHAFAKKLHADLGPVASFWFGETFVVSTASPHAFRVQKNLFDRPEVFFEFLKQLFGTEEEWRNSIQFKNGSEGQNIRQTLDKPFTHDACVSYIPKFLEAAESFTNAQKDDKEIPAVKSMLAVSLRCLMVTCFGDYFSAEDKCSEFAQLYKQVFEELESKLANSEYTLPNSFYSSREKLLDSFVEIAKDRRTGKNHAEGQLLIDELIDAAPNEEWLRSMGISYVVGGYHTSGTTLGWMMYYLGKHPECQEKVYREFVSVLGNEELYADAIKELVYTRKVIDETFRLSVLAPMAARVSEKKALIIEGHRIPPNTPILQSLGVLHQDEELWTDSDTFNPDRFNEENVSNYTCPYFGFAGKRKCPAYRFSYFEFYSFLSVFIRKFSFTLKNPNREVERVFGLVTHPSREIMIVLHERH